MSEIMRIFYIFKHKSKHLQLLEKKAAREVLDSISLITLSPIGFHPNILYIAKEVFSWSGAVS